MDYKLNNKVFYLFRRNYLMEIKIRCYFIRFIKIFKEIIYNNGICSWY